MVANLGRVDPHLSEIGAGAWFFTRYCIFSYLLFDFPWAQMRCFFGLQSAGSGRFAKANATGAWFESIGLGRCDEPC